MKKKKQSKETVLRENATTIMKEALNLYLDTLTQAECAATATWFLALRHGVAAEIYDGIDNPITLMEAGKKATGLSVMIWSDLDTHYTVDIITEKDRETIKAVYCSDFSQKSIEVVADPEELMEWLVSRFEHEILP